jgi:hypothetical protein
MDTMPTAPAPPVVPRRLDWSRYAAIGFAVCYPVARIWSGNQDIDIYSFDPDKIAAHFAGSASTDAASWSGYVLLPLAAAFLAWTLARIRTSLDRAAGGASVVGTAALVGGSILAVTMVAAGLIGYVGAAVAAGTYGPADPQTGVALLLVGATLFVAEGLGAAILAWAVALGGWRTRQVPGWLVWTGFVLTPLLVYSWLLFIIPTLIFVVWLVTVSMMLKIRPMTGGLPVVSRGLRDRDIQVTG